MNIIYNKKDASNSVFFISIINSELYLTNNLITNTEVTLESDLDNV